MPKEEDEITEEGEQAIKSVAKGGGIVLFGLMFSKFMGYVYNIIVARVLGSPGYGVISLATSLVTFVSIFCFLGLKSGIRRYAAFYNGKGNKEKTKGTVFSGLKVIIFATALATVFLFLTSEFFAVNVFNDPSAITVFKIFALGLPFYALSAGLLSVTDAFQKMKYRMISRDVLRKGSRVLFVVIFIVLVSYGLLGVAYAYVLSYAISFFAALYFFSKKIYPKLREAVPEPNYRELLSYSWPLLFVSIMGTVLGKTDQLMLGYFLDSSTVGIYRSTILVAAILTVVLMALRKILLPVLSELLGKENKEEFKRTYKTATKWTFALTLPLFVVMVLFAPQVLDLIFGQEYVAGATALSILAVTYFIKVSLGLSSSLLRTMEKTKLLLVATVSSGSLNVILNALLIPVLGMEGAAIAFLASVLLLYSMYMYWSYNYLKTNPFKASLIKSVLATIFSAAPIYFVFHYLLSPVKTWMLPVAFFLFISLYGLLFLMLGGLDNEDILVLKAVENKTGIRIEWLRNLIKRFS